MVVYMKVTNNTLFIHFFSKLKLNTLNQYKPWFKYQMVSFSVWLQNLLEFIKYPEFKSNCEVEHCNLSKFRYKFTITGFKMLLIAEVFSNAAEQN